MKAGSIGDPDIYLGAKVKQMKMNNGVTAWAISPSKYVNKAINNCENWIQENMPEHKHSGRVTNPFPTDYNPTTNELNEDQATYYQSQIGILWWIVELGRVDIATEVSLLASHVTLPRMGHLQTVFHIYAYLRKRHNSRLALDPSYPEIDMRVFHQADWTDFYGDIKKTIPDSAPEARGKPIILRAFVDSDHANDKIRRRSRMGFWFFINMACIIWHTKWQATVESAVFCAEFMAMKQAMEVSRGLRYKLRMMGVPIEGPTHMYGDNMSAIHNTQCPKSQLNKKSYSICYPAVREVVAMGELLTGHIRTDENPADILTKVVGGGIKRKNFGANYLYDIHDGW